MAFSYCGMASRKETVSSFDAIGHGEEFLDSRHETHSTQKLILGTHTSQSEQNYLLIAEAELPNNNSNVDIRKYETNGESGSLGTSNGKGKVEIVQRINHEGEVNRARYMPQQPEYIASKCVNGNVLIFKYTEFESVPKNNVCQPTLRLKGHTQEGYGLCWSSKKEGLLASGSDDCKVCIWDIFTQQGQIENRTLNPLLTLEGHSGVVEDVAWHRLHEFLLGTVCDDKHLRIFDTRTQTNNTKPAHITEAHKAEVNSIDFSPFSEYVLATGSADKTVKLWDMRNLKSELHTLASHTDEVFSVSWSPSDETILASCGTDRRVRIWDISRIGMEQSVEDAEDGPPELLFIHGGHTSKISDFSWNPNEGDEWVIASVAEDNILQIWQPSDSIFSEHEQEVGDSELQ